MTTESHPEVLDKVMMDVSAATQDSANTVIESLGNRVVIVVMTLSQPVLAIKVSTTVKAVSQLVKLIVSLKPLINVVMVVTILSQPKVVVSE